MGIVYGGAKLGLMGALADAALAAGGEVVGVMPQALVDHEIAHHGLTELHITSSMHERKATMADLADGFVALPGGVGTLEELVEIVTWAQLGLHAKPCGVLDTAGYYTALRGFLDHAASEGFIRPQHRGLLLVDDDPGRLLDAFATWRPPTLDKWIDRDET
jgi:uncharacterized protein (TIGR00730 family)